MTNVRLVVISYFLIALLVGMFFTEILRMAWDWAGWADARIVGEEVTLTSLVGFGLALASALGFWMRRDSREVSLEVAAELRKVTWPGAQETKAATIAVLVCTAVVAVILGVFDFAWADITSRIYEAPRYLGG
jgi:preprotein translocase subunit SecE